MSYYTNDLRSIVNTFTHDIVQYHTMSVPIPYNTLKLLKLHPTMRFVQAAGPFRTVPYLLCIKILVDNMLNYSQINTSKRSNGGGGGGGGWVGGGSDNYFDASIANKVGIWRYLFKIAGYPLIMCALPSARVPTSSYHRSGKFQGTFVGILLLRLNL